MGLSGGAVVILVSVGWFMNLVILSFLALFLSTISDTPVILNKWIRLALGLSALIPWIYVVAIFIVMLIILGMLLSATAYSLLAGKPIEKPS